MANGCQLKKQPIHGGWQALHVGGPGKCYLPFLSLINVKNNGALVAQQPHSTWFWFIARGEGTACSKPVPPILPPPLSRTTAVSSKHLPLQEAQTVNVAAIRRKEQWHEMNPNASERWWNRSESLKVLMLRERLFSTKKASFIRTKIEQIILCLLVCGHQEQIPA